MVLGFRQPLEMEGRIIHLEDATVQGLKSFWLCSVVVLIAFLFLGIHHMPGWVSMLLNLGGD